MITFLKCEKCGNVITYIKKTSVIPECCDEPMKEIHPGTTDGAIEKHVPVAKIITNAREGEDLRMVVIEVGEMPHPMVKEHYIEWVALETERGYRIEYLNPGDRPKVAFVLNENEKVVSAYAYCNIHGLWVMEM